MNKKFKAMYMRLVESLEIHSEVNNLPPLRIKLHRVEEAGVKYIDWKFFDLFHPSKNRGRRMTIYLGGGDEYQLLGEDWGHVPFSISSRSADIIYESAYNWIVNGIRPEQP